MTVWFAILTGVMRSLNFELRAWTDEFADWGRIRSDLAVAIHDGVAEAGWTIPFPQREVRILKSPRIEITIP